METKGVSAEAKTVDRELIETWLTNTEEGRRLGPEEATVFTEVAIAHNLNPFRRELHARIQIDGGVRKLVLITGFEVYLRRAAESGLLDGYSTHVEGEGEELKAVAEIHRKDWSCPYLGEAYFSEAAQRDEQGELLSFWKRSGRYMLRKVCLAQSFRLAFPEVLGGLPYEGSEVPQETSADAQTSAKPRTPPEAKAGEAEPSGNTVSELVESIKRLALGNQANLKPHHVSWIIGQLNEPKSVRQLEGLKAHVERAIDEATATPPTAEARGQGNVRRIPSRLRPSRTTQSSGSRDQAAGAEGLIF